MKNVLSKNKTSHYVVSPTATGPTSTHMSQEERRRERNDAKLLFYRRELFRIRI
jgi:hypothetical protein